MEDGRSKEEIKKAVKIGNNITILLVGIVMGLGISLIVYLAFFLPYMIDTDSMEEVCDKIGGEPYLYRTGWSEICGFDVYRGTCIQNNAVLDPEGYLIAKGKRFSFNKINSMLDIEEGPMSEEDEAKWKEWERNVCQMFSNG